MPLLRTGWSAGVSVGGRLSGVVTWPAQVHDCKAAVRWVRANAEEYGLDPDRIAAWGRSAGGHLALMLGVSGDVPGLEGDLGPHVRESSRVACAANYFGVSGILAILVRPSDIDRTRADAPEAKLLGGPLRDNPEKARAAPPITDVTRNDPPVLTLHGDADRHAPRPQAIRRSTPSKCATNVTASASSSTPSVIASSFRSLAGKWYVLPLTRSDAPVEPAPSWRRSESPASRRASVCRASSSSDWGFGFMAGRSSSQTRSRTACMSLTPLVMATTASCSGSTMQNCPKAPSPR